MTGVALLLWKAVILGLLAALVLRVVTLMQRELTVLARLAHAPPRERPRLLVEAGEEPAPGAVIELHSPRILIGRGDDVDIRLAEPYASHHHCRLQQQQGRVFLEDLESTNGTRCNDRPVEEPIALRHGDVIAIGETRLRFQQEEDTT